METYADLGVLSVARAEPNVRAAFIRRTYIHLAGAIAVFVGLEAVLLRSPLAPAMLNFIEANRYGWLMILGAFILVGWLARGLAVRPTSTGVQYAGLALYVVAEAIIFVPILYIAAHFSSPDVIPNAAIITGGLFAALTFIAFTSGSDFSFLRGILSIIGTLALGTIIAGVIFGLNLGLWFSVIMVALAGAAILYDTGKIMRSYPTDKHVAASLELFASVALMFWYVLRILMSLSRR